MYIELRIIVCVCMLAISSIIDFRSREIPDKIWLIFGGAGAVITIMEVFYDGTFNEASKTRFIVQDLVGIGMMSAIGYATYRTGLFGGADPKALVAIAIILPSFDATFKIHNFAALSIFSNALILSLSGMFYNLARNSISIARGIPIFQGVKESRLRKALAFTVGFSSTSSGKYAFAMEGRSSLGEREFRFNPASYDEFVENDGKRIWVTYAMPFIVYIALGFVVMVLFGDVFAYLLHAIFLR